MSWLALVTGLGLGACLADDMGLGKTVQVIGLLLHRKSIRATHEPDQAKPSLLVVPASLLANWKAELDRFAPTLSFLIAHPSENTTSKRQIEAKRRSRARSADHNLRHVIAHRVAATTRLGPRHSRRSPGDQELGHAAIAGRQGAEGARPVSP